MAIFLLTSLPLEVLAQDEGYIFLMECEKSNDESGEDSDKSESEIADGEFEKIITASSHALQREDGSLGTRIAWHTGDASVHLQQPPVPPPEY